MRNNFYKLVVFSSAFFAASAFMSNDAVADVVSKININRLSGISEQQVRDVLTLKEGSEFTNARLEQSVSNLNKWGAFSEVKTSTSKIGDNITVNFDLKVATVVDSIEVSGNYPYIDSRIKQNLTLHPGDNYTREAVDDQIERIKAFYARKGFVGTEVYVDEEAGSESNGIDLTFHIGHGEVLRYRDINISGNRAYPKGRFVSKINPLRPYSESRLKEALRDLREFYQKHGYPRAKVKLVSKKIDLEKRTVNVDIEVREGPKVEVKFHGANFSGKKELSKAVTFYKEGSFDEYEIQKSRENIVEVYKQKGFPDVKVTSEKRELKSGNFVITFNINAGKSQKIRILSVDGAKDAKVSEISKEMANRERSKTGGGAYFEKEVSSDDEKITTGMSRFGYLKAKVGSWKLRPTKAGYAFDVNIPVDAGQKTLVDSISFSGADNVKKKGLLKAIKAREGNSFNLPGVEEDRQRILAYLADNGFPYAKVESHYELNDAGAKARISYSIVDGGLVRIGRILIVGDVLTSQNAIKKAMTIGEGEPFSYEKIIQSQLNIRRLGAFSYVNINTLGIDEKEHVIHLRVKVEELPPFLVDVGVNYSTYENFTGSLTFTNLNAFGWAKSNSLQLTAGQRLSRAEIAWHDPRFLSSDIEMTTNGWLQYKVRPSYSFVQAAGSLGWFKKYSKLGFLFRWELDRNYFVDGSFDAADVESFNNNTLSTISLSSSYDTRDSYSDPRSGFFTLGSINIANEIQGNKADFATFIWQGEGDVSPFSRTTLSTALRFGRIEPIGSSVAIPINELFFLGGNDTLRGFDEDSLGPIGPNGKATGARTRWILNEELRLRLMWKLQAVGFFDMGALENNFESINWSTIRRSIGVGIRYVTPVGPIRLDYGFKLDRKAGESKGRLHFTFGYVF